MAVLSCATLEHAINALKSAITTKGKVVFDIDDTIVQVKDGQTLRIDIVHELYLFLLNLDCSIHFVSARQKSQSNIRTTRKMLEMHGFHKFEALHLMERDPRFLSQEQFTQQVADFKLMVRKSIGYPILLSIGNSWSDLLCSKFMEVATESGHQTVFIFPGINERVQICVKLPRKPLG
jgi:hypothetical protein